MFSVGIDTTECARLKRAMANPRFFQRVFGAGEQALLRERGYPSNERSRWVETAAAGFCAKEAFAKAMKTGVRGFSLYEVELLRQENGAPYLCLSGNARKLAEGWEFSVSITHTKEYASAIVLAEKRCV